MLLRRPILIVGVLLLLGVNHSSLAQSLKLRAVDTNAEYNALFKRMFDDPTNVPVTFRFAELATRLGDYEAAIGALTRILYFNPHLARVKLQLGQLYFKLGAYEIARSYFEEARRNGPPSDVLAETERFVAEIDRRERPVQAASEWSVFAQTGVRYQSNATQGAQGEIRSFGVDVPVDHAFAKQPDYNWFAQVGASYVHNLNHGNEDAIEAAFFGYYGRQFRLTAFNFAAMEAQVGERFSLPISGVSVKPYAVASISGLGDAIYSEGGGPGFSARFKFDNNAIAWIEPSIEYRYRNFFNSANFPTSSQQTGGLLAAAVRGAGALADRVGWSARFGFDRAVAAGDFDFDNYNHVSFDVGFPTAFDFEWGDIKRKLVVTPTGGMGYYNYYQTNPAIDPSIVRKDHDWRVGVMVDAQISGRYGVRAQFLYTEIRSTLPNFDVRNYSVMIGPTYSF